MQNVHLCKKPKTTSFRLSDPKLYPLRKYQKFIVSSNTYQANAVMKIWCIFCSWKCCSINLPLSKSDCSFKFSALENRRKEPCHSIFFYRDSYFLAYPVIQKIQELNWQTYPSYPKASAVFSRSLCVWCIKDV